MTLHYLDNKSKFLTMKHKGFQTLTPTYLSPLLHSLLIPEAFKPVGSLVCFLSFSGDLKVQLGLRITASCLHKTTCYASMQKQKRILVFLPAFSSNFAFVFWDEFIA